MLGLYPGMDTEILIPAFIVIVIGGMGSLRGAFVGSLLIGIADTFGKAYFQSIALFLIYLAMLVVLLIRPQGLVRHQVFRRRDCARRLHHQRAGHGAHARRRRSSRCSCCWRCRLHSPTTRARWFPRSSFSRSSP